MSFNTIYLMLMLVRMAPALPLIFLLMIHRVFCAGWGVSYSLSHICALKDSSVIMNCTYTYPTGYWIMRVFWSKGAVKEDGEYLDLSEDPEYSQRLQYLGDKQQICTIRLSHVTLKDSHMYYFRFITDKDKWIGKPGVTLTVTDLQVESPERVTEGDSVRLTCKSSCTLTDRATFIWYRNSQKILNESNKLNFKSVRREDAGRYSCAVHGHNHISPAVQLNVTYPPRNVSVLITGSGEIVSGDSVTLICSSDSNPPALNFSWFKENESSAVGSGQSFSALQSGRFYCQAHNQHGSQRSDAVTVTVHHGAGRNVIVIAATSGGLFFIIIIIIIMIIILFIIKKRRSDQTEDLTVKQNDLYSDAPQRASVHDEPLSEPDSANDAPKRFRGKTPESRETEEIQYATVQYHRKKKTKRSEKNENQYDDQLFRRSTVQTMEEPSMIYSSVK
ncbi:B-cell receptor CD22-like isoform X2 [Megalobrama amblycephala]|uniref:B-cell receptor CD22-like isoform X2 n=1 Tax=Megalobrama amblycephala TaxID=75352 RepID=UPI0020146ED9|nr:B-cell receptor CD22-like isoform X2 [Megalobrama amblycephala]